MDYLDDCFACPCMGRCKYDPFEAFGMVLGIVDHRECADRICLSLLKRREVKITIYKDEG